MSRRQGKNWEPDVGRRHANQPSQEQKSTFIDVKAKEKEKEQD